MGLGGAIRYSRGPSPFTHRPHGEHVDLFKVLVYCMFSLAFENVAGLGLWRGAAHVQALQSVFDSPLALCLVAPLKHVNGTSVLAW